MTAQIVPERLAQLDSLSLGRGAHSAFEEGHCAMEAVAWLAGEPHSDTPFCACPVVAKLVMRLNDRMPSDMRTELLRPLLPRIVGSRASRDVMVKRGFIAADAAVRVFAPLALEKSGRLDLAEKLRAAPEIVDRETALKGREIAAAYAADDAAANASANAAADAAAAAAAAAAYAAADAAAYAADAAYADAAAYAAYAAARRSVFVEGVKVVERMLEMK